MTPSAPRSRAERVRQVRSNVAACVAASFIGTWGLIYTTGSMGSETAAASTATTVETRATTVEPSTTSGDWSASEPQVSPVTTRSS